LTTNENPGCLTVLLGWLGLAPKPKQAEKEASFPYHQRDDFLSPAEISFYHVLQSMVGDEAVVCPKWSLGDLFYAATGDYGQNRSWMNRVDRKHVDFLVCDPGSMRPTLAVELDDASHERAQRQERDQFVDRVFSAAGLPLARIPAQAQYNTDEVKAQLRQAMEQATSEASPTRENGTASQAQPQTASQVEPGAEAQPEGQDETAPPTCPTCGAPMVLREVKRNGPRQGEKFWGCPNFPKCRGTRDLEDT
jgi:hypothetical protein